MLVDSWTRVSRTPIRHEACSKRLSAINLEKKLQKQMINEVKLTFNIKFKAYKHS